MRKKLTVWITGMETMPGFIEFNKFSLILIANDESGIVLKPQHTFPSDFTRIAIARFPFIVRSVSLSLSLFHVYLYLFPPRFSSLFASIHRVIVSFFAVANTLLEFLSSHCALIILRIVANSLYRIGFLYPSLPPRNSTQTSFIPRSWSS